MTAHYDDHGVKFDYPEDWTLDVSEGEDEVTISIGNESTAFWSITLLFDRVPPDEVLSTALAAFREEYGDLDEYATTDQLCDHPTIGADIEFVCMELINTAALRVFRTGRYTAFVMYQATDHELEEARPVMQAISESLEHDFGDEMVIG